MINGAPAWMLYGGDGAVAAAQVDVADGRVQRVLIMLNKLEGLAAPRSLSLGQGSWSLGQGSWSLG